MLTIDKYKDYTDSYNYDILVKISQLPLFKNDNALISDRYWKYFSNMDITKMVGETTIRNIALLFWSENTIAVLKASDSKSRLEEIYNSCLLYQKTVDRYCKEKKIEYRKNKLNRDFI